MAVAMAVMIMAAQRMAVSVTAHEGVMRGAGRQVERGALARTVEKMKKAAHWDRPFKTTTGAGEEIRTLDFNLGKVALYP